VISPDHRAWLASLPLMWGGYLAGKSILAVHGSPWKPLTDYLYADNPGLGALASFDFDLIGFGQTHRPLLRNSRTPRLLNPGSIGQSRATPGKASLAIWETERDQIDMIEREYDPKPVLQMALEKGAGPWAGKHLNTDHV
jgi:predicted phosphodiesterase